MTVSPTVTLRAAGVALVLAMADDRLPQVLHWGRDLGDLDLAHLALASVPSAVSGELDVPVAASVLAEHALGWPGLPGVRGHRADGSDWSPLFVPTDVVVTAASVHVEAIDKSAALALVLDLELTPDGVVRMMAQVENQGASDYLVDGVTLSLPVPTEASMLLDLTGRHLRERAPQRQPFTVGARLRENRRGRTGADATLLLIAAEPGVGFRSGAAWGVHVAWSGDHATYAERWPDSRGVVGGGELLLPGEVRLAPGDSYTSPALFATYGDGLDELSGRLHAMLRARPTHPNSPRPVVLNTWEAVYFNHDLATLKELARSGAEVGVERFVLDDGWFRHRRDDTAGLGDWYVDETVWPDGLAPLIDYVTELGMTFGLWVEPEMINPDSDLARAHPDWILQTGDRLPPAFRYQQVLDLANADAYAFILERLDSLLTEYDIDYLKWDHNRDLVDAGHGASGVPGVHGQTAALYALLDELRVRHPGLEIESCSSGGARVDLGVLQRTDRVWASDCNDALERQGIQRWTQLLIPPEMVGAHVGANPSHTTGRRHDMSFRAGTALFGHFGIETDLRLLPDEDRAELARWVELYKRHRGLLHSGTVVRADHPDSALALHGVVATTGDEALFALVSLTTSVYAPPGRVRLPGLEPASVYDLRPLPPGDVVKGINNALPPWWATGVRLSGAALGTIGVQAPNLFPEQLVLLHATRSS